MISEATVPEDAIVPPHVAEVREGLRAIEDKISALWAGSGIDGREVAVLLRARLPSWEMERTGHRQELTWRDAGISPFLVDGQGQGGRSIIEIEGGGALQNNRLHRDLLNTMLLDDVEHLVLVVPNLVHGRSPFTYAVEFCGRLRSKGLLDSGLTVTIFGYGSPRSP